MDTNYLDRPGVGQGGIIGGIGGAYPETEEKTNQASCDTRAVEARRSGVRDRIHQALVDGKRAMARYQAASEANTIIEKYPDIARLLDLLDRF